MSILDELLPDDLLREFRKWAKDQGMTAEECAKRIINAVLSGQIAYKPCTRCGESFLTDVPEDRTCWTCRN